MLTYIARSAISAFERRWNYDPAYLREVLAEAGAGALVPIVALGIISSYRRGVPARAYYAAKLTAAVAADCGPCAQLVVSMAAAEGVAVATLRALVAGDRAALDDEERLGYDLARATLAREPAVTIRATVLERWGRRGLLSLAYALVTAQAYPTLKYALGHGQACTRLHTGGLDLPQPEKSAHGR